MTAAIQKSEPSVLDLLANERWPRAVIEVVRKLKVPKGCSDEEFYVFMQQCQMSGLNPLLGHAYCVPRRTNIAAKGEPAKWVTNHVFQSGIDGMRYRAAEFPDFASSDSAPVYEGDLVSIDKGTGEVRHKTNPNGQRPRVVSAWGRVRKKDGSAVVVELPVSARGGESSFWAKDPGGMLAKCAEAAALRQAYPRAFAGVYAREEMPDEAPQPSRAEVVLKTVEAQPTSPPALPASGPVIRFGQWRGTPMSALTEDERKEAIAYAEWQKAQPGYKSMSARVKEQIEKDLALLREAHVVAAVEAAADAPAADYQPPEPPADVVLPGGGG